MYFTANAEIPEDPKVALRENAMRLTRQNAVSQVKKMMNLVDDLAATTIRNSVIGEELRTSSGLGCKMIMAKYVQCIVAHPGSFITYIV